MIISILDPMVRHLESQKIDTLPSFDPEKFTEDIDELRHFCILISDVENDSAQKLMKNYVLVRLISIIEFHLKGLVSNLIDELDIKTQDILRDESIPLKLDVLDHLESEKMTKGNMISAFLDIMNPGKVYAIMSKVNKLDFFEWYQEIKSINSSKSTEKVFDEISYVYALRNDIVHNLKDVEDSTDELVELIDGLENYTNDINMYSRLNLFIYELNKDKQEIIAEAKVINKKSPGKFLEEFTKITEEYRTDYKPKPYKKKRSY